MKVFSVRTQQHTQFVDITREVQAAVSGLGVKNGTITVFVPHTTAGITVNENADPDVRTDIETHLRLLAPDNAPHYRHDTEGPDDMPAHVRSALTQTSLAVPLADGRLALGTWQGIYLYEHRRRGHRREVMLHLIGE